VPHGHYALGRVPHSRKMVLGQGVRRGGKGARAGCRASENPVPAGCRGQEAGSGPTPHGREAGLNRVSHRREAGSGPVPHGGTELGARCRMGGNGAGPDSACAVRARESG